MAHKQQEETSGKYCIYCGEEKGHSDNCPMVAGIPKGVMGFTPVEGDPEYNLSLGRLSLLYALSSAGFGPKDKKIRERLVYEQVAFQIRRIKSQQLNHSSKADKPLTGWLSKRKLKKLDKNIEDVKKFAETWNFPMKTFENIVQNEKIMLANFSGKEYIPVYRNIKTNELIYLPIE